VLRQVVVDDEDVLALLHPLFGDGTAETTLGDYVGPPPVFVGDQGSRFLDRVQVAMGAWALEQLSAEATGQ